MNDANDRIAAATALLREAGGRSTTARRAVLRLLVDSTHLSAAEIHARLAAEGVDVDLSTVHRVLTALADAGAVHVVPVGGTSTYGMADHGHHHTVCRRCGTVRQLPSSVVAPLVRAVSEDGTFLSDMDGRDGGVVVYGRCTTCPPAVA